MLGAIRSSGAGGGGAIDLASPGAIGLTTPNTASFTDLTLSGRRVATPSATQTLIAASSIAPNAEIVTITAASAISLSSNPQISAGINGQSLVIVNVGSTNGVTFANGNGLILGQPIPLYPGKILMLRYLTAYSSWVLDSLIPESVALTGSPTVSDQGLNSASGSIANTRYVNTSNRPHVRAVRVTTNQSIAHNAWTALLYNSVTTDTATAYNATTGIFTVPASAGGLYAVSAGIALDVSVQTLGLAIWRSGVEIARLFTSQSPTDTSVGGTGTVFIPFSASDAITIQAIQTNSGSLARNFVPSLAFSLLSIARLNV